MGPMKKAFRYNSTAVAIAIILVAVSTIILSSFSYVHWVGKENQIDTTIRQGNDKLLSQYVDQIEQKIIENDGFLSDMIDVNDPNSWRSSVELIKKGDFNVDEVFIFRIGQNYPVYPPYSDAIKNAWASVNRSYREEPDLRALVLNQTNHLHKERSSNYFFASYVLKESRGGARHLIFFQMNISKILAMVDRYLHKLESDYYVSVVDFDNISVRAQYQPLSRNAKYFLDKRFPGTLYKWLVQVVPRNYSEMERNERNRRRANLFLIILSMSMIFCCLAILYVLSLRERQLVQLKEDFINNVSHELKTPLSLIRMFSEILVTNRVKNDEARQEYYSIIHNESDRMGRLISNLLDFGHLERKQHNLNLERTNMAQLVLKELEAYRYQIQKEGFELITKIEENVPDILADPNAISMALFNLLDNAVKYSGDCKRIHVTVARSNGTVDIAVQDEGLGIPESERQKIFDKFFRGSSAGVKKIRGSGIGLSITRQVAEMHGGEVRLVSEVGRGSTFTLKLPIDSGARIPGRDLSRKPGASMPTAHR
jgi:two-component system phosphate regulon sensor histidine kinase PhoR